MANRAHKIAGPIIDREIQKHFQEYLRTLKVKMGALAGINSTFDFDRAMVTLDEKQIGGAVRVALANKFPLCVIEDWAHEPRRRKHMSVQAINRRHNSEQVRKAQQRRRERRQFQQKKIHRTMQKIGRAVSNFFRRITR